MRKAFSLFTAIIVMMMMASVAALVFNTAGKITSETSAQYRKEQSMLLAKSYTEFAILAIQEHGMAGGCLRTITANINSLNGTTNANGVEKGEGYYVEVKIQYIGLSTAISCNAVASGYGSLGRLATSTSSNLSATIDVYVQYHDPSVVDALGGSAASTDPWVTYHRRTLQKL